MNMWVAVALMFGVTYALRAVPLLLVRGEIRNARVRAFLAFSPYAVLTAMTIPSVVDATAVWYSGVAGLAVAIGLAWRGWGLFPVAISAAAAVWVVEFVAQLVVVG